MADWCLATGQPIASWMSATRLQRQALAEAAKRQAEKIRDAMGGGH